MRLAPALDSALRRIGKPWYRRAPFSIFLDQSDLSANPALWKAIEAALDASEYLILLASTNSARSEWVGRELDWWLSHRGPSTLLIVVTGGEVEWDPAKGDFDWDRSTALNNRLRGQFAEEPLWVDLRWARSERKFSLRQSQFRNAVLQVAPPLYGKSRQDLDDQDTRQYRMARRMAAVAGAVLLALTLGLWLAARAARHEQTLADCRALAAHAVSYLDTRLDLALLLGVESARQASCTEGESALLTALQHRPRLAGFLSGHTDAVTNLAFTPDGRYLVSSSRDRTVRLWDIGKRRASGPRMKGLYGLSISPDGSLLASADLESVALWKLPGATLSGGLQYDRKYEMDRVTFSPDGRLLATRNEPTGVTPEQVFLWDASTGQLLGPPLSAHIFAFSPDGKTLATDGEMGNTVVLRDVQTRRPVRPPLEGPTRRIRSLAFSADGSMFAAGGEDNQVFVWDLGEPQPAGKPLIGHRAAVNALAFSPRAAMLASGSGDGSVILWDTENWQQIDPPLTVAQKPVFDLAFTPDGRTLVSTSEERVVVWSVLEDLPFGHEMKIESKPTSGLVYSPDGTTLATIDDYKTVSLSDAETGSTRQDSLGSDITAVAFSPDGRQFASVGWKGKLELWDRATGEEKSASDETRFRLFSVAFSPDGRVIAAGGDAVLLLWDVNARRWLAKNVRQQKDRIWSVAFSPDGKLLVSGGNTSLGLWDANTGAALMAPVTTDSDPDPKYLMQTQVAFSPDGKLLAYRQAGNEVALWDVARRRVTGRVLSAHKATVTGIAFSADGRLLATGAEDDTVVLWDVAARQPIGRPFSGMGEVESLAFRPKTGALAALGDKRLLVWDVNEVSWRDTACRLANRNLTRDEWNRFFGASVKYHETCPEQGSTPAR